MTGLRATAAGGAVIAVSVPILLAPALWNGFPFTFYDTGAFVEQALTGKFVPERQVFYAWFLALTQPTWSLWPVVVLQAAITVLVMMECARVLAPGLGAGRFLALVVALTIGTGIPWYVGQVLPDFLAPLMVLTLYLLGFHADALDLPRKWALAAVAVLAATAHGSHLALALGLAVTVLAFRLLRCSRARWAWPAIVVALSVALLVGSNFARTGEAFLSRAGSAFAFGRLVQDGIVKRLLDETCPQSGYKLCAYKNALPLTANDWLWGPTTPFWTLGGFEGAAAESSRMIADSLRRYPLMHLRAAASATVKQFFTFRTGDGIEPQPWPTDWIFEKFLPGQHAAYRAARQRNGQIDFGWLNGLHVPVGLACLAATAGFVAVAAWGRRWDAHGLLPAFLLIALLGNAFICGVLSNPHDRYQSRLIWIAPFALALLAAGGPVSSTPRTARSSPLSG